MDYFLVPKGDYVWNQNIKTSVAILFGRLEDKIPADLSYYKISNTFVEKKYKLIKTCVR